MEYLQPFSIAKDKVAYLNPSASCKGYLELNVVEGGPVYLFRGRVNLEAAVAGSSVGDNTNFDLAANHEGNARISIEPDFGTVTVYSRADSIGFLRFIECDCP
jgi:hypothetical protein